jgi:YegS/Rv2252/BmrU family lipid kinase|tara:strand:- start:24910 stop:25791 length:882 start_codon:yes stop_codon:yes gene_type:complete
MSKDESQILIIYNPAAQGGASAKVWEEYERFLTSNLLKYSCYTTLGINDAGPLLKLIQTNDFNLISILGGDGTINLAINELPHLNIPVHLIPAGSGNDLAKMVYPEGIPSLTQLFNRVLHTNPATQSVDIWRCNKRLFVNGFGCGFDGSIAYNTKFKKGIWGTKMKYWVEIMKHIVLYPSPTITVNSTEYRTFMLSAANGSVYGGDFKVAPGANISDGKLDVVRIKKVWVPLRFFYLPLVLLGKHLGKKIVSYEQLDQLTISANKPIPAHLDGEPMNELEYKISKEGEMDMLV